MEDLLVRVVAEGHMGEGDVPPLELHRGVPVVLLLTVQNLVHRAHDGAYLSQTIHKVHGGEQRPGDAQGQHDGGDESLHRQTPAGVQEPAHRQNGDHGGGEMALDREMGSWQLFIQW